ncbi:hypothetical protein [Hymenobacter volaticus]|uniref:Uncharacterized protein n=1 Tax=Hymenobacter volaticus TaxID=2932254 RepID=A0ABY4GDD4_9BACT|nr:hypothetical protein [Hymenobacter volaticus]UOQ68801.1 hypothetical protein MUN86_25335 [Hymenobacter volaticus]
MNLLCTRRQKITRLVGLVLAGLLFYGCEEWLPEWENHPPTVHEESADVVYDWYKLIGQIQLRTSPQPNVIANNRSFGYIGVGLYEAVQPGLKGAVSLSSTLYQMPTMPKPERNRGYVWGASANAALASLSKQLLVGLTQADRARLDSLETAYQARFSAQNPAAVVARSQAFGQAVATAIYNWSTTDNFSISSDGYVLPVFPGAWVPTPPPMPTRSGPS